MTLHTLRFAILAALTMMPLSYSAFAQVSNAELQSISIPDRVETPIGELTFFDGVPSDATIDKVYDNLDRMRGVEVYLDNVGAASLYAMRTGSAGVGANASNKVTITEQLLLPTMLALTGNTSTLYALTYLDLKAEGPLVVELPPGMLGFLDDAWFRYIEDMGLPGPDKGKGGKYLLLPPDYAGEVPKDYFVVKMPTYHNLMFLRGSIAKGLAPAVENIKSRLKIYPLSKADSPPATEFVNISGKSFNTIATGDFSYFEGLNQVVQEEPTDAIGPEVRGTLAAIGIVKGQPFKPDARMQRLLSEAATIGAATARAITYQPRIDGVEIYPDTHSAWTMGYANKNTSFEADGAMNLDARVLFYYNATGVTPAMAMTRAGAGSDYGIAYLDANKKPFDGSKTYKLHLPPDVPVNDFWAVTIYDTQTRSLLQTSQQFPTLGSQDKGFEKNADGSYDVFFAPEAPMGKEGNWLQTIPGKSWFTILRMYGPLEPWIDKTWRPSEIALAIDPMAAIAKDAKAAADSPVVINIDNFNKAQTDFEFAGILKMSGGINAFHHNRTTTPIDKQNVIRMNRDTLYSLAVVNISDGATITLPNTGKRYMSLMIINNDGYVNKVFYGGGSYKLTMSEFDTPFVGAIIRTLANPEDAADMDAAHALQDKIKIDTGSQQTFVRPDYDNASYKATLEPILDLAKGLKRYIHTFGSKAEVDPVHFLIGSASAWGGLPDNAAVYVNVQPDLPVGKYELTVKDVPVQGFWSISLYNAKGYFQENDLHAYNLNNLTAKPNSDGSYTLRFGGCTASTENCLPIMNGWNYAVRMYEPSKAIIDGTWAFPGPPTPRNN